VLLLSVDTPVDAALKAKIAELPGVKLAKALSF